MDHLRPEIEDQPSQHGETLSLLPKKKKNAYHAQRGLTACLLGLIRAILALSAAITDPLVGDAFPVLALELVSFTSVAH